MKRKALLVGINNYPGAPLRGCVNDVLLMYKILSEKFLFETKNIQVVTDEYATQKAIFAQLKALVSDAKPGDHIFFHYSGHGSQVVADHWTGSQEADGRDEILCPVDLNWNDPMRDHDIGKIFKSVEPGVNVTVVLDCCHSGTGLRNIWCKNEDKSENDWVNRFMPPPPTNILTNPKVSLDDDLGFILPPMESRDIQTQKRGFVVDTNDQGNAILISGCQDNQTSADAYIGGRYHGALTYLLAQALQEGGFTVPLLDLITKINEKTDLCRFEQNPQLEGRSELFKKPFLGS